MTGTDMDPDLIATRKMRKIKVVAINYTITRFVTGMSFMGEEMINQRGIEDQACNKFTRTNALQEEIDRVMYPNLHLDPHCTMFDQHYLRLAHIQRYVDAEEEKDVRSHYGGS